MKIIQWLVSLVPAQARTLVAVLLIAISALSGVVVYLYKDNRAKDVFYGDAIQHMNSWCRNKIDSLNTVVIREKDSAKAYIVDALNKVIEQQNKTIDVQTKNRREQRATVHINNTIIQQNEQKIKYLTNGN